MNASRPSLPCALAVLVAFFPIGAGARTFLRVLDAGIKGWR